VSSILIAGCTLGGIAAGSVLYRFAARVPPAAPHTDPEAPLGTGIGDARDGADAGDADSSEEAGTEGSESRSQPSAAAVDADPAVDTADRPAPPRRSVAEWVATAAATGALFGAAAAHFGSVPELAAYCVLFAGLVTVSVTDIRVGIVPSRVVYPTLLLVGLGLLGATIADGTWHHLLVALACGVGTFVLFFAAWWFYPRGMGWGDIRLSGVLGGALGYLGLLHLYVGLLFSFLLGAVVGAGFMIAKGTGRGTRFPFAPALAAGTVIGVLWGGALINHWVPGGS
jgi:leader peptidase (prepilin peptidase)/N-methyltransferase